MLLLVSREEGESEAKETSGDTRDSWRQFINERRGNRERERTQNPEEKAQIEEYYPLCQECLTFFCAV